MPGLKTFRCARILLGGIEVMHVIAKGAAAGFKANTSSSWIAARKAHLINRDATQIDMGQDDVPQDPVHYSTSGRRTIRLHWLAERQ